MKNYACFTFSAFLVPGNPYVQPVVPFDYRDETPTSFFDD